MSQIRRFCNADLPSLVDLWVRHWATFDTAPDVSVAMIEQAILARWFFDPATLLVAEYDGHIHAWCHWVPLPEGETAVLAAICFSPEGGRGVCEPLLEEVEARIRGAGYRRIVVGPLRDQCCGYTGLAPIGHGIGVPAADSRTASLLSQAGYSNDRSVERMRAATSLYRVPLNRETLQLGRATRLESESVIPHDPWRATAMSHLDIERHRLVEHRTGNCLAEIDLWTSDAEVQVMKPSEAILDLEQVAPGGSLDPEQSFLIGSLIRTLANRRIFHVETVIDQDQPKLSEQLGKLQFQSAELGIRWEKSLAESSMV